MIQESGLFKHIHSWFITPENPELIIKIPWYIRIFLAILGGASVFLAFPNYDQFYLAYFALAFQLWAIDGLKPGKAFLLGWLSGIVTNVGGFYWVGSLLHDFAHMDVWLSVLLCAGFCLLQGLFFGFWAFGIRKLNTASIWTSACGLFVALEMFYPMLFPWYYGNSQYNFVPALQIADIFGILGISLLLVVINVIIYDLTRTFWLKHRGEKVGFHKKSLAVGLGFVIFSFIYAPIRMHQIDKLQETSPQMNIGLVEADVGIWEVETQEKLRNNLFTHQSLSRELSLEGVELIVWPESAFQPGTLFGTTKKFDDPLDRELDSLYSDWFQPHAHLIYHTVDAAFGQDFHRNPVIHFSLVESINRGAEGLGFMSNDRFYPSLVSGYSFPCNDKNEKLISRCPYHRIVPDDLVYYLPSAEPLRDSRNSDLLKMIHPEDIVSPLRGFDAAVIFGTLSIDTQDHADVSFQSVYKESSAHRKLFNTAQLVDKDGQVIGTYHKNYLLLFGEYVPLADKFPVIYEILPEAGNLTPGTEIKTMDFHGYKLGPIICYEDILPRFVRSLSALEPNVFINVTNDAWFGKTAEPMLHLAVAMVRAVEHRKWLVRSTNTGVSAFIDPNGRIVQRTSIYEPEILRQSVAMMPQTRTIYSYIGDVIGWLALLWLVFLMCVKYGLKRKSKREGVPECEK